MKPDVDIMRRIMMDIANLPISKEPPCIHYRDVDDITVDWHLAHMIEANLLKGKILGSTMSPDDVVIFGITPDGYKFVHAIENDTLLQKTKSWILKNAMPTTVRAIFDLVIAAAEGKIGLP